MLIAEILKDKGPNVFTAGPADSLESTIQALESKRVGALVVCDGEQVVGIVSERDLVRAVARHGGGALSRPVQEFMTQDVVFAEPTETVATLMERMTDRRIRHLPVLQEGQLVGVVSIGDLVKSQIAEATFEAESMKAYIGAG
ncbi:CBS domain-containing protein [Brevundimonas aveniformis]|uniref:CBS domain-containing protein n=1 Tax=Brevundimonas aveniformis TaxID=370977 RepID=UPI0003F60A5F|nr:CBS domain-containing protein [Brevundimonas aveniformis]